MRLQSALDQEVHVAVQRFLGDGLVQPDVDSLYSAIQKSNSSLKRRSKKQLEASIERVLTFMVLDERDRRDSEAEPEKEQLRRSPGPDVMNKSLRANMKPTPATDFAPPSPSVGIDGGGTKTRRAPNGEPISKRPRTEKVAMTPPNELSLRDVGGMGDVINKLGEHLVLPLLDPESYSELHLPPPRGILLHGPPGCGKTMVCRAWAAQLKLPVVEILGPSIVSSMSGDSEKGIRERFEEAKRSAPCLIFIDELDAIAPKRESSQSQMEKRIVAQLLVSMDDLGRDYEKPVMVLAATNRPDSLDPALRRGGRFDTEISINVPNERVREQILMAQTRKIPLSENVDFRRLAKRTAGFVGADLRDLVGKAGSWRMSRYREALSNQARELAPNGDMEVDGEAASSRTLDDVLIWERLVSRLQRKDIAKPPGFERQEISMDDFLAALPDITPSSKREGFATIPDVSWEDIGALQSVREKLQTTIVEPIKQPELYEAFGIKGPDGVLLWGPPGCGKTLLAKAAAAESKANFISVKGPELVDKFVGESEAAVRKVFERARSSVPCVIFFDEIDALAPRRGDDSGFAARVVGTLLSELDGLNDRAGIYVIGATNRVDMIDDAMMRPGRLGRPIYVGSPGEDERVDILKTLLRGKPVNDTSGIVQVARECEGFSGADLQALLQEAVKYAISRKSTQLEAQDFRFAKGSISGSIRDMKPFDEMRKKFGGN